MFRKDNNEDLVICDFGLATEASQEHYLFVRCGTPGYVAPEIINIKDLTLKSSPVSDVFAAGVIFHELLLGESVFAGSKYQEVLNENRKCHFDFTRPIYSRIPSNAFNLLKQMLEINPTARITAA